MSTPVFPIQLLIDHLGHMVFVVDGNDKIIFNNNLLTEKTGWSNEELSSKTIFDFFDSEDEYASNIPPHNSERPFYISFKCKNNTSLDLLLEKKEIKFKGETFRFFQAYNQNELYAPIDQIASFSKAFVDASPDLILVINDQNIISYYQAPTEASPLAFSTLRKGELIQNCLPKELINAIEKAISEAKQYGEASVSECELLINEQVEQIKVTVGGFETNNESNYIVLIQNNNAVAFDSMEIFNRIIDQSDDGIVLIDENCKIVLWNKGLEKITGFKSIECLGFYIWDIMFKLETLKSKQINGVLDQLKQRYTNLINRKANEWIGQKIEEEIYSKTGVARIISSTLFEIESGKRHLIGTKYHDITEQKNVELSLRENEEYIRTLYYDSPVPVLVVDEKSQLVFDLNNAAAQSFGYKNRTQLIGMDIQKLIVSDYPPSEKNLSNPYNFLFDKSISSFDCQLTKTAGNTWDANVHVFRLSSNDKDLIQLTLIDTSEHNNMIQALFESESRYRAVSENANAGIIIVNLNEQIEYVNQAMALMLGYDKEDMAGRSLIDFSLPESFHLFTEKTKQRIHGLTDQYENVMLHKNGTHIILSVSASALRSLENEIIGTVGVMLDITAQKANSKKLVETSEQLQAIIAAMPDKIYILDRKGFVSDYFSNTKNNAETDTQTIKESYLSQLFEENQVKKLLAGIHQSLEKKETVVVSYQNEIDGSTRHFEARISPMTSDKALSVVRDTTTIINLESDLIYNNSLLRTITQLATPFINLPVNQIEVEINHMLAEIGTFAGVDRVYIFDYNWPQDTMSNTFEWCSENATAEIDNLQNIPNEILPDWVAAHKQGEMTVVASITALPENDFLRQILEPQGIKSLITIPLMEADLCLGYVGFDAVLSERTFSDSEISLLRIFAELLTNLKIKQRTENLLTQNRNILEKQNEQLVNLNDRLKQQNEEILSKNQELDIQRERALASDKLKTAFLNNVSHEVRTPLNGIIGFAQFLEDDSLSREDKKELIVALNGSVTRLTDTITDIMDASLLMSGNMTFYPEEINISGLFDETYNKHIEEAAFKKLELKIKKPIQDNSFKLVTDLGMLRKILNELVGNAIKYTKQGHVSFEGKIESDHLVLFVEDSGIGISNEVLPIIFEPFMQADISTTRSYEGSGLGLTVVKGYIELLKGKIDIQSEPDKGTIFTVKIPLEKQSTAPEKTIIEKVTNKSTVLNILVAEDDAMNILYIKRMLKNTDFKLFFAINGIEAVEAIQHHPEMDLILMDIKMPEMDGLEATRIIKASNKNIPIIAVTAFASNEDRHQCIKAGCDDYISKPFKTDTLFALIDKYVNKQ